jgi:hypothetical protein
MPRKKKVRDSWRAAICYNARSIAGLLRESLDELKFDYTRDKSEKHFTRLVVIVPLPQLSYVFQFKVNKPSEFIINTYDVRPTHSGEVHFIELQGLNEDNLNDARAVLKQMVEKLPRKPWKFFWAERLRYGIIMPEYMEAKSTWYSMGIS